MYRIAKVYFYTTLPLIARQLGGVPRSGEGVKICFILAFYQKLIIQTKKILSETILSYPILEISLRSISGYPEALPSAMPSFSHFILSKLSDTERRVHACWQKNTKNKMEMHH